MSVPSTQCCHFLYDWGGLSLGLERRGVVLQLEGKYLPAVWDPYLSPRDLRTGFFGRFLLPTPHLEENWESAAKKLGQTVGPVWVIHSTRPIMTIRFPGTEANTFRVDSIDQHVRVPGPDCPDLRTSQNIARLVSQQERIPLIDQDPNTHQVFLGFLPGSISHI